MTEGGIMKKILSVVSLLFVSPMLYAGSEPIYGYISNREGITFQVKSGGCTQKEHFSFKMMEIYPPSVELVRNRQDLCEANLPYGELITFKYKELGLKSGTPFSIANPLMDLTVN